MKLAGFGFTTYRSFGDSLQFIGPCSKITLLAGQNNSGKSNVLTFLHGYLPTLLEATKREASWKLEQIDRHLGSTGDFKFAVGGLIKGESFKDLLGRLSEGQDPRAASYLERVIQSKTLSGGGSTTWFVYRGSKTGGGRLNIDLDLVNQLHKEQVLSDGEWYALWGALTNQRGGAIKDWIPQILNNVSPAYPLILQPSDVVLIPAIRRIGEMGSKPEDYSGTGLIDRLAQFQNPGLFEQKEKDSLAQITAFLRSVLDDSEAWLEIPYARDAILVHMNGRILPLTSLGTGVHEVVILAAAATVLQNKILCIEEPELHLHPLLQRKLLRYLHTQTDNQYFITTHSAHLLETPSASVFHVRLIEGASAVERASTPAAKASICADLGYRASDLLQANCIVWVEGPSDRIYLLHWLAAVASDLVEGIHFSIMFYGGRLLSHLSANDPEVAEFISLRRLNRFISIVMDSDKRSPQTRINDTKRRVAEEFGKGPGLAWITKGRDIENYVPISVLATAIKKVHPGAARIPEAGNYDKALVYSRAKSRSVITDVDKVKVAHAVAQQPAELDILDLRQRITEVIEFIRSAND